MPVALLLKNIAGILKTAGAALAPWTQIVPLESTIVERARSAFLVHWFGPRIPVDGLSLKGIIVNIGELSEQRQLAERSLPKTATGPNLFEPVMGIAGLIAGMALTPMGTLVGVVTMLSVMDSSVKAVLAAIGWIVGAIALVFGMIVAPAGTSILVGGAIAAGAAGLFLAMGVSDRDDVRSLYNVFGALAGFMNASARLLRQLIGGAAEAKNPLTRRILELMSPIAALMAQLLGAVAVLVRRIGPVLPSVAAMLVSLGALIGATFAALKEIAQGLIDRIDEVRNGPLSLSAVIKRVVQVATQQIEKIQAAFKTQMTIVQETFTKLRTDLGDAFSTWIDEVIKFLEFTWDSHPVIKAINGFRKQIAIIKESFATAPKPKPTGKPGFFDPLIATLPPFPKLPDFPDLPVFPDTKKLKAKMGGASVPELNLDEIQKAAAALGKTREPIALSEDARKAIDQAMRRPSIFEPERKALELQLGMTPEAALADNAKQLEKLREVLAVVVGRILPPEMRAVYAPMLTETLTELDSKVHGVDYPAGGPEPPVLDLPATDELRPVVKLLRFRMPGADTAEVRAFQDKFIERLRTQKYRVPGVSVPVGAP